MNKTSKNTYTAMIMTRLNGIAQQMRKKMKNNDAASNSIAMGSILRWIRHWLNGRNGERTHYCITDNQQQQNVHLKSQRIWAHFSVYIAIHAWSATFCCLFVYNSCNSNAYDTTATGFPLPTSVRASTSANENFILVRHTHAISMSWFMYENKWK